jgi:hypothetical protein
MIACFFLYQNTILGTNSQQKRGKFSEYLNDKRTTHRIAHNYLIIKMFKR